MCQAKVRFEDIVVAVSVILILIYHLSKLSSVHVTKVGLVCKRSGIEQKQFQERIL